LKAKEIESMYVMTGTAIFYPLLHYSVIKLDKQRLGLQFFRISVGAKVRVINTPGRQSQRIQNVADDKLSAPKTKGTNGVELVCSLASVALEFPESAQSKHN
jgi:hypothetical protein